MRTRPTAPLLRIAPFLAVMLGTAVLPLRAGAGGWEPGPARFGVGKTINVPVTMADGTILRADVFTPTDPDSGEPAPGPFPVILTQTPYGKRAGESGVVNGGGVNPYLVERGYIHAVADIRGTGGSQGEFGALDPIQGKDGAALVRWAAQLPHSNGRVGLLGLSYLGFIQFLTAAEVGPDSPLKAIFPIAAGNDTYRDVVFGGGLFNGEFMPAWLATVGAAHLLNPLGEHYADPAELVTVEQQHLAGHSAYYPMILQNAATDGDLGYDEAYWMDRNPLTMLERIAANGIPAFLVGAWNDLFQRGTPLNYSGLQNAWAGRPVLAPMLPDQPVTARYQLMMGPWYHFNFGAGLDFSRLQLQWFDTWLKDEPTGMAETPTPVHTFDLGSERWVDVARYPFEQAAPTTYFLGEGGTLATTPPAASGSDTIVFTGVNNPCSRSSEQWGGGGSEALSQSFGRHNPCASGEAGPFATQAGPGVLTYTSAPLDAARVIAGPIGVTLHATSTRPDAEWVATVEDVAPDGSAQALASGALLGSFRAIDPANTWTAPDGRPLLPYHPYTRASTAPVTPGEVTRFDIEVFPTFAELAAGHRLRLTITTSDTPHLTPMPRQLANLVGGVYAVQRGGEAASFLELPLAPPEAFATDCAICR